ncbi:hypothetical protein EXIGLDRAFT_764564 [Exidia glandulosa HHB12029]|uniref:Uncharacterized protein n=1 Tax=Exidia glandulosa HHB12029 TaxID=1314781 RepID=A0A165L300_EXIGL|nr:hypothetical protein EXIGLDRAFT_764564 [Exidia glandulosa HHB12029]
MSTRTRHMGYHLFDLNSLRPSLPVRRRCPGFDRQPVLLPGSVFDQDTARLAALCPSRAAPLLQYKRPA